MSELFTPEDFENAQNSVGFMLTRQLRRATQDEYRNMLSEFILVSTVYPKRMDRFLLECQELIASRNQEFLNRQREPADESLNEDFNNISSENDESSNEEVNRPNEDSGANPGASDYLVEIVVQSDIQ